MAAGTTIKHKRKTSAFVGGELLAGEWGLNTNNGQWYYSTDGAAVTALPSGGLANVVEDTTPQLGGDLDGQSLYDLNNIASLDVRANVASAAGAGVRNLHASGLGVYSLYDEAGVEVGRVQYNNSADNMFVGSMTAVPLYLAANGTIYVAIAATGETEFGSDVGIGVTPSDRLHILKSANADTGARIINATSGASARSHLIVGQSTANDQVVRLEYANTSNATWGSDTAVLSAGTNAAGGLIIATMGAAPLSLYTNNSSRLTIASTGAATFSHDVTVPDEAYDATAWNGSLEVPTKNAVRDKFESLSAGGGLTWNEVTGTSQTAAVDNGYIANNASLVTVTLPTTAAVGKVVRVAGKGAGGWRISQNASEQIHFGNVSTTIGTGGYLASSHQRDAVELLCVVADTEWMVLSSQGNITYV